MVEKYPRYDYDSGHHHGKIKMDGIQERASEDNKNRRKPPILDLKDNKMDPPPEKRKLCGRKNFIYDPKYYSTTYIYLPSRPLEYLHCANRHHSSG